MIFQHIIIYSMSVRILLKKLIYHKSYDKSRYWLTHLDDALMKYKTIPCCHVVTSSARFTRGKMASRVPTRKFSHWWTTPHSCLLASATYSRPLAACKKDREETPSGFVCSIRLRGSPDKKKSMLHQLHKPQR